MRMYCTSCVQRHTPASAVAPASATMAPPALRVVRGRVIILRGLQQETRHRPLPRAVLNDGATSGRFYMMASQDLPACRPDTDKLAMGVQGVRNADRASAAAGRVSHSWT